ncbi:MAG TPA: hypothetical protein VHD95_15690 [Rhizomicrobium sp.]|nr:hypothetical protein [Rhizomicrobium sp.]
MYRIITQHEGRAMFYAGQFTWTDEPQRALLFSTRAFAQQMLTILRDMADSASRAAVLQGV